MTSGSQLFPEQMESSISMVWVQKKLDGKSAQYARPSLFDRKSVVSSLRKIPPEEYLCTLNKSELISLTDNLEIDIRRINLENYIFEEFLKLNEPTLLTGMDAMLEATARRYQAGVHGFSYETLAQSERDSVSEASDKRYSMYVHADKKQRLNLNLKSDLILRTVEQMHSSLEKVVNQSHQKKCALKAELEELKIHKEELSDTVNTFELLVVKEGTDPITQRIAAEKFLKYMNDWIKSAQFTIDKMRLYHTTSKIKLTKLINILVLKEDLGKNVHVVDFEKLTIENQRLLKTLEQKNNHLIELKKMSANANLILTTHKNFLQTQLDELNLIKLEIKKYQKRIAGLDVKYEIANKKLAKEQKQLKELQTLVEKYKVPSVLEYIEVLTELSDTKKLIKVWKRKLNIAMIALSVQKVKLQNLVGKENVRFTIEKFKLKEKVSETELYIKSKKKTDLCSKRGYNSTDDLVVIDWDLENKHNKMKKYRFKK